MARHLTPDTRHPLCEICSIRPATIVIGRRRMDDAHRTLVCPECARERLRLIGGAGLDLAGIASRLDSGSGDPVRTYSCRVCGTTLADIIADGRPGCCGCYSRFASELGESVQEYQGHSHHVGKSPL